MKQIKLGDYIDILTDYHSGGSYKTLKEKTKILYEPSYAVVIRTLNFEGDDFTNDLIYCDKNSYDFLAYAHVHEDDVLMNKIANPGSVYIMPKVDYKTACGMNLFLIRFKNINQRYMYYVMKNNEAYIKSQTHGTTTKTITKDEVRDLVFFIHETPEEQNRVEQLLTTIDYKISNNKRVINILNNISKLLYDYWFVQFDFPDENGKPYKSSGGKMVWNEELKREIPDGWKVKELDDYIRIIRGVSYNPEDELKRETESSIRLLKSNNIQNGALNFEQPIILPADIANEDQWLTEGSVFITMSSGSKKHMGKTAIVFKSLPYVFGAFCAKIAIKPEYRCILSTYFRSDWFRVYIENVTAGTSINNIGQEHLTKIKLPFPPVSILSQYESIVSSLFIKQGEIIEENQELASLRDFLLPMLMNGQVKVKKGENQ